MDNHHLVFRALSDAIAMKMIEILIQAPAQLSDFEKAFGMPRPTLQKKLNNLQDAGLIEVIHNGRQRTNKFNFQPLSDLIPWIENLELKVAYAKVNLKNHSQTIN